MNDCALGGQGGPSAPRVEHRFILYGVDGSLKSLDKRVFVERSFGFSIKVAQSKYCDNSGMY